MKRPSQPENEEARLRRLKDLDVLDTPAESGFDDLARIAAYVFEAPIALVSLVDEERQWFKARVGLDAPETPREISFCGHAVATSSMLVVPDASKDERFTDNPLVTGDPRVCFYAGAPLETTAGSLGTLCVIDHKPRKPTQEQLDVLAALSRQVVVQLDLRASLRGQTQHLREQESELTGLRQANETLSEGNYARFFDLSLELLCMTNFEGYFTQLNPAWTRLLGFSIEELKAVPFIDFVHPDDRDATSHEAAKLAEGDTLISFENRYRTKSGEYKWLLWSAAVDKENQRLVAVARDITERKITEQTLAASISRYQSVFASAVDGIITIGVDGEIESFNPAATRLFGYQPDEVLGRNIKILMPEPYHTEHDGYLQHYRDTGKKRIIGKGREVWGLRKDGKEFPLYLGVAEFAVGGKRMFSGIVRDISDQKAAERLKNEFVSTVSHELRTPLTSIRGSLGLLLGHAVEGVSGAAVPLLQIACDNTDRLVRLINDMLDIDKIESGQLALAKQRVDLRSLASQSIVANESYAVKHEAEFCIAEDAPESAFVHGDPDRLVQVIDNLLSNAAKYGGGGQVLVSIEERSEHWRFCVSDHGPGIPQEFQADIFARFSQADQSDSSKSKGTGLGLAIAKSIIELHSGEMGFETEAGKGTRFFFDLPSASATLLSDPQRDQTHALLVEDDADIARLLQLMLAQRSISSDIAPDAETASELLLRNHYDVVTLDLGLPGESGMKLFRRMMETPEQSTIPVVVISATANEGRETLNGEALAVVDWLSKPIDEARLQRALRRALGKTELPKILYVEDDVELAKVTEAQLAGAGEVVIATSIAEARDHLSRTEFDAAILDLSLPDGDGRELLQQIRGQTTPCPVIIYSGTDADAALSQLVSTVLVKSRHSSDDLAAAVAALVSGVV